MADLLLQCAADKAFQRQAGNFQRLLERKEHASLGALIGGFMGDILALEQDLAAGHGIFGGTHQNIAQGGFACAVGAHQHMGFALVDGKIHAVQQLFVFHACGQTGYVQNLLCHKNCLLLAL